MKAYSIFFATLFCFILSYASAQEKDLKAKPDQEINNSSNIANLLNSKSFEFVANICYPTSGAPKNLVGNNYSVTFSPEEIVSNLPFYGRAYNATAMGRDKGMRFKGQPENFTVSKNKEYQVNTTVRGESDTYELSLSVSETGYALLSISSNDRGTISYQGEIVDNE